MAAAPSSQDVFRKYEILLASVAARPGWVAFSGGVDSSLLLKAVAEAGPSAAVALFADSPLQSRFDRENVKQLSEFLGVQLQVVEVAPLLLPEFALNPGNRCYFCKKSIYRQFQLLLPPGRALLDGTNRDDLETCRPGQQAMDELGVVSPLVEADLRKAEVRELARRFGLPNWSRPSSSCLATRIPEGFPVTPELLRYIEERESLIRARGFGHIRLRLNDGGREDVTVELAREEMDLPDFSGHREAISQAFRQIGVVRIRFVGREGVFVSDPG